MTPIVWNVKPTNADEMRRRRYYDAFMMDFENYVLSRWDLEIPTGPRRYMNETWAALMQSNLEFSDTCWEEYVEWVKQGGGDEWFVMDAQQIKREADREAAYMEAQSKLRLACVCRDLVRPLHVSLYERIPSLAATALRQAFSP